MGMDDKAKNKAEEGLGKGKEHLGESTGDRDLQAEGRSERSKANLKQAGQKLRDAFKRR